MFVLSLEQSKPKNCLLLLEPRMLDVMRATLSCTLFVFVFYSLILCLKSAYSVILKASQAPQQWVGFKCIKCVCTWLVLAAVSVEQYMMLKRDFQFSVLGSELLIVRRMLDLPGQEVMFSWMGQSVPQSPFCLGAPRGSQEILWRRPPPPPAPPHWDLTHSLQADPPSLWRFGWDREPRARSDYR